MSVVVLAALACNPHHSPDHPSNDDTGTPPDPLWGSDRLTAEPDAGDPTIASGECDLYRGYITFNNADSQATFLQKVTPPSWPYSLSAVSVRRVRSSTAGCDEYVPVDLFVVRTDGNSAPDTDPEKLSEPATVIDPGRSNDWSSLVFDPPLRFEAGESYFIGMTVHSEKDHAVCTWTCSSPTLPRGVQFEGLEAGPPYTWVDFVDYGIDYPVLTSALGQAVE